MINKFPEDQPFLIRGGKPEDYPFILSSWSNEARKVKYDNFICNSIFYPRQKQLIDRILSRSIIKVAHLDDDEDEIVGYLIVELSPSMKSLFIHWAHTKPLYRKLGICKTLLGNYIQDQNPIFVATSPFLLLPKFKKKYGLLFDPSILDNLRIS